MSEIGISVNGKHSYYDFGCRIAKRTIGQPKKNRIIETVPFSNAVYNFSALYGAQTYGERTLNYQLVFLCDSVLDAQNRLRRILAWLDYPDYAKLIDGMTPDLYYMAEMTDTKVSERNNLYTIDVTFRAQPHRYLLNLPNPHIGHYPDVNGDGTVDATDAALILEAAGRLGAGEASGLTPEQEAIADADLDGAITATDAAIVSEFAALTGSGNYTNDAAGWAKYMQARQAQMEGVI